MNKIFSNLILKSYCEESKYLLLNQRLIDIIPNSLIVNNCIFIRTTTFNSAGGIFYTSSSISIFFQIKNSIFQNCSSTTLGGVIKFENSGNSNITLEKNCIFSCFSGIGQFSHIVISQTENNLINFNLISILKSSPNPINNNQDVIWNEKGNHLILNTNISSNFPYYNSGITLWNSLSGFLSFSTFKNNSVEDHVCLYCYGSNNFYFNFLNIINNLSPNRGIFFINTGQYYLNNSNFYFNKNVLFNVYSGSIIVNNSFINHFDNSFIFNGNCLLINTLNIYQNFLINHLNTYICLNEEIIFTIKLKNILLKKMIFNFFLLFI